MINKAKLADVLVQYKKILTQNWWKHEQYKWKAVKHFQEHWDINAADFLGMLKQSLAKTFNLLVSVNHLPRGMIQNFAQKAPEEVRAMFIDLFDETKDLIQRIQDFKHASEGLLEKYGDGAAQHYQSENAITTYLWLRYPNKYYIYKLSEVKKAAKTLGSEYQFKKGAYTENLRNFYCLYDELCAALQEDAELKDILSTLLTDDCTPDHKLRTMTIDVGFYISRVYADERHPEPDGQDEAAKQFEAPQKLSHGWLLSWNPKKWDWADFDVAVQDIRDGRAYCMGWNCSNSHIQIGDRVFLVRLGQEPRGIIASGYVISDAYTEKNYDVSKDTDMNYVDIALTEIIDYRASGILTTEYLNQKYPDQCWSPQSSGIMIREQVYSGLLKDWEHLRTNEPQSSVSNKGECDKAHFLRDVYMSESGYDALVGVLRNKKNLILQGAPGVGKTFAAKKLAYAMMGEKDESRIQFVQFHQNYSYEDFVMGYKPSGDGFELKYGVFYQFCQTAARQPQKDFFFIIDEINRGNMSKIFGELLMLIERDYRGTPASLAYDGQMFAVPENLYLIAMMNTADRSLAMIDYALRRRFSFFDMEPGFESEGFRTYQAGLNSETLDLLIAGVQELNREIAEDKTLGKGFCIGHSYFCNQSICTDAWLRSVVEYEILPMLREYWFDDASRIQKWENNLRGVLQ